MKQILCSDWLPGWARWTHLACSGFPALIVPQKWNSLVQSFDHIINPLLTKLVRSTWLDIGLVLSLRFYGPRTWPISSHLDLILVNKAYIKHLLHPMICTCICLTLHVHWMPTKNKILTSCLVNKAYKTFIASYDMHMYLLDITCTLNANKERNLDLMPGQ